MYNIFNRFEEGCQNITAKRNVCKVSTSLRLRLGQVVDLNEFLLHPF